jgi:hypothetical protein
VLMDLVFVDLPRITELDDSPHKTGIVPAEAGIRRRSPQDTGFPPRFRGD